MMVSDLFKESFLALSGNKVRSSLTILGIVIGIASVIAMVSIGQGTQSSIEANIQSIGSNLLIIMPGAQRGFGGGGVSSGRGSSQTLTQADADAIKKEITSAKAVAPENSRRYQITAKGTNTNTQVVGTSPDYAEVRNVKIDSGSFITAQQVLNSSKVAVLGPTARDDLFGVGSNPIGQAIKINKIEFKVVGVTTAKGGSGFSNQDDMVFAPISSAQRYLAGGDYVTTISVEAQTANDMTTIQQQLTDLLLMRHKISDPLLADFNIMNQADIAASASAITNTLTLLLAAISGISLLVGGIGIMNMMLTTVTERTREIGLRKAIGATSSDISGQFLTEATMLTITGGLVGVLLGWLASLAVTHFAGMATTVSISAVLLAFGVSAAIGLIFGYYPARRAAKLNPIEALRFE